MRNSSAITFTVVVLAMLAVVAWWFHGNSSSMDDHLAEESLEGSAPSLQEKRAVASTSERPPEGAAKASTETHSAPEAPSSRDMVKLGAMESASELATVRLTVVDSETKKPVPGAGVLTWLTSMSNGRLVTVYGNPLRADAQGSVTFNAPTNGICLVVVRPPEGLDGPIGETFIESLTTTRVHERQVELPAPTQTVMWVKLLTAESGVPIESATVRVHNWWSGSPQEEPDSPGVTKHFQGGGTGLFSVTAPSWESHRVCIDELTHAPIVIGVELGHETPDRARVVSMSRSAALRVNVTSVPGNRVSKSAFHLACTEVVPFDRALGRRSHWNTSLDERGLAFIDDIPAGVPLVYELTLGPRKRWPAAPIVLAPGETRTLTFDFDVGAGLVGRLVDQEGNGISSREMWAIPATLRQAEWNSYMDDYDDLVNLRRADLAEPEAPTHASSSSIFVPKDGHWSIDTVVTDRNGNFRFENVPAGVYWVGPSAKEATKLPSSSICPEPVKVDVKAAQETPVTVQVWWGRFIRGRIVNSDGSSVVDGRNGNDHDSPLSRVSPREDWRSTLKDTNAARVTIGLEAGSPPYGTFVSDDGSFTIGPMTPGDVSFRAVKLNGAALSSVVKAKAGDTDVILRLEPWAQLRGTVVNGDPRWPVDATLKLVGPGVRVTQKSRDDFFDFSQLPAGTFTLTAETESGAKGIVAGIELKAGEVKAGLQILVK